MTSESKQIAEQIAERIKALSANLKFKSLRNKRHGVAAGMNVANKATALHGILSVCARNMYPSQPFIKMLPSDQLQFRKLLDSLEQNPEQFPQLIQKYETLRFQAGDGNQG